jgi:hypothetical protein
MTQMLAAAVPNHLVHLAPIDVVIVVFYFLWCSRSAFISS